MAAPTGRVAVRRAATKEAILDAAWTLARTQGLGGIGMRALAAEIGMTAPSLYEYFSSKDAIYDAMFAQGNRQLLERFEGWSVEGSVRDELVAGALAFVEFCNADVARFQLLFHYAIPGWRPSPEAYAVAVEALGRMREHLGMLGITDDASLDLWTALVSGLASQQVANDPGGTRWLDLVEPAVDMFLAARRTGT